MAAFAKYWRGPSRVAIPILEGLDPPLAAPMLCGGVTVFTPLKRYGAGTRAKNVGVMGVGGLGHFAILFAKAMGAEVTAISRSNAKKDDATKLGASKYITTGSSVKTASQATNVHWT
jgi:alcohol dehydrogenase (NADP+)